MTAVVAAALISALAVLTAGLLTAFGGPAWKSRYDQRRETQEIVDRYSRPLLQVAHELQSRLYNIVRINFLRDAWRGDDESRRKYAEASTLWLFGQYLGWMEILRREVQFLELGDIEATRLLRERLLAVRDLLATDRFTDPIFQIYRSDQRAIGERMILRRETEAGGTRSDCLGYAEFVDALDTPPFARWFQDLRHSIEQVATAARHPTRLVYAQRALIDLVDLLDSTRSVFPNTNDRGKLPLQNGFAVLEEQPRWGLAHFLKDAGWDPFEQWVAAEHLATGGGDDMWHRVAEASPRRLAAVLVIDAKRDERWFQFCGWAEPPRWVRTMKLAPHRLPLASVGWQFRRSRASARRAANRLLERYDRPKLL